MTRTYLSVCSGIEAASVAWHTLGWRPVAFSEIDPFACAMLAARFPLVPNLGDMERYREWPIEPGAIDVLVGGTPCQSFSVAGLRRGLDDPRGNLALVYLGLVDRFRPRWIVWENVPGVLSADGGRAFGAFLGGLAQLGYGFAYRVLDAQYTRVDSHPRAVPQRRRRVFVVGCAGGDARRAASVLLEPEGVRGDPPTRRASWEGAPRGPASGARDGGIADVSPTVTAKWSKGSGGPAGNEAQNLVPAVSSTLGATQITSPANPPAVAFNTKESGRDATVELCPTLRSESGDPHMGGRAAVAFNIYPASGQGADLEASPTDLASGINVPAPSSKTERGTRIVQSGVRRLTPVECERLMGFPDDWTLITYRGKPAADGPRYKALGNSMATNVMRWIGLRIAAVEGGTHEVR